MAELDEEKEVVGMIRGCIKIVTCGKKLSRNAKNNITNKEMPAMNAVPVYTKVAYILGLRVSPSHRCLMNLLFYSTYLYKKKNCHLY